MSGGHTFAIRLAIRLEGRGPLDTHAVQRALIQLAESLDLRSDDDMTVQLVGKELRITLTPAGQRRLEATSV